MTLKISDKSPESPPSNMNTRRSPIAATLAEGISDSEFVHPTDLIKIGIKGRALAQWAAALGIDFPPALYDTRPVGDHGLLARVGSGEIVLESLPNDPLLASLQRGLEQPSPGIYRVEQQAVTFELSGPHALGVFAQTCGLEIKACEPRRIVFTRVAGVSCGLIPLDRDGGVIYRFWVDYTFAPYLWNTLAEILGEIRSGGGR